MRTLKLGDTRTETFEIGDKKFSVIQKDLLVIILNGNRQFVQFERMFKVTF